MNRRAFLSRRPLTRKPVWVEEESAIEFCWNQKDDAEDSQCIFLQLLGHEPVNQVQVALGGRQ